MQPHSPACSHCHDTGSLSKVLWGALDCTSCTAPAERLAFLRDIDAFAQQLDRDELAWFCYLQGAQAQQAKLQTMAIHLRRMWGWALQIGGEFRPEDDTERADWRKQCDEAIAILREYPPQKTTATGGMMDFSKLTELEKGFRPLCCDKGIGLECCTDKCAADEEQSELTAERAAKAQGVLTEDALSKMLRRAYNFGQTYWQQADSEYLSQQRKSNETADKFAEFVTESCAALAPSIQALPAVAAAAPDALADFQEGQWWVAELDNMVSNGTADQKRAVAVVHHMLRAVAAQPEAKEAPAALSADLHDHIMRLPCDLEKCTSKDWQYAFKEGHKVARHAAAELALAAAGNSQDAKDAARMAKWIVQRGLELPDHACAQCVPHSDILKPDFVCAYHFAAAMAAAPSPAEGDKP